MSQKSPAITSPTGISLLSIMAVTAISSFVIYYLTAYRTITWWDSGEYSLAAAILGVAHPPGCLLSTILGWLVLKLAVCGTVALTLNLFSGLTAALTAVLVGLIAGYYLRRDNPPGGRALFAVTAAAIIGSLTLAFGETFWHYATQFTPYIFTVLFTALILLAMIKWAGSKGHHSAYWLFVITLLFGLDFSVHRTNLLMAPGLIIWMLIFNPRTFLSLKTWLVCAGGLILGLAVHFLIIPMAAAKPFLNASDPDTWSKFWDYVTLQQLGGGFLVQFFPRKAAFWSVQVADYLRAFGANFFSWNGPVPVIGLLPGLLGITGLVGLWRKNRRLAVGMIVLFLLTSAGAIMYFNIPANFFRSLHRHYMPSFIIFAVWMAYGTGSLLAAGTVIGHPWRRRFLYPLTALLILALPGYQIARNFDTIDGSKNFFAADYALNMLNSLPENSILLTFGDNDTFPLWYFQIAEGIRPDVTVLNNSLLNTPWFIRQCLMREPDLPLGIAANEIDSLRARVWADSTIVFAVEGTAADFGLPEGTALPDSMRVTVKPTIAEKYIMASDQLLMNLIRDNRWRRPIYIASTGGVSWLSDYLLFEGLVHRLTPLSQPPVNRDHLAANLLDRYSYRGYADEGVFIDPATKMMVGNYLVSFIRLAQSSYGAGEWDRLELIRTKMAEVMPLDRLRPLPEHIEQAMQWLSQLTPESTP